MPKQAAKPDRVKLDWVAIIKIKLTGRPWSAAERPHCAERSRIREARFRREHGHRSAFVVAEGIGLITPVEIMRVLADGVIGMLGGLVIGIETLDRKSTR